MQVCQLCNKEYDVDYYQKTTYCSKSCATTVQRGAISKETVETEVIEFLTSKNTYCLNADVLKGISRSSKTLTKMGISIKGIQDSLGFTRNCSMFQEKVYTELKHYFTDIICEATFTELRSPKGYPLRVDFFIENCSLIIEADGTQHSDKQHMWYSEYAHECDLLKEKFAKENNLLLLRIPYVKRVTSGYIKNYMDGIV